MFYCAPIPIISNILKFLFFLRRRLKGGCFWSPCSSKWFRGCCRRYDLVDDVPDPPSSSGSFLSEVSDGKSSSVTPDGSVVCASFQLAKLAGDVITIAQNTAASGLEATELSRRSVRYGHFVVQILL